MKICPKCQKTYQDEALNFCLDDGAVLNQAGNAPARDEALPETVMINPPRDTSPNPSFGGQSQPGWGQETKKSQPTWGGQAQTPPAWGTSAVNQGQNVKPKSKSWMWVVGILAAVVLVCGGGLIGLIALVASVDTNSNTNNKNISIANKTPKPTDDANFDTVDLSNWTDTNKEYAESEYKNGEYVLWTKESRFYYVITATNYRTENSTIRVTVRNPEEKNTSLGFGLIFHSAPKPLTQDYGFLIDSVKKKYRVVRHSQQKETNVVNWTSSSAIKSGTEKNVLEVRDKNGKFELYINGNLVETLTNKDGFKGGVPGIYSAGAVKVAFSDLQISK